MDAPKLVSQLRGDLDWIVMKCLEKDRSRRYETANGLAMDLKRHLDSEPVLARPPSKLYEFHKTFRRHRVGFAATAAIILVLTVGSALTTWQAVRAKRAEALALQTRSEAEELSNFILEDFYAELEPTGRFETVARLATKALAYYDRLPPSLRTRDTERNRAMAQARLALIAAGQANSKTALPMASAAKARFEQMRKGGDQSEGTLFGLGLALYAQSRSHWVRVDTPSAGATLRQGIEVLKPVATSPDGSRRIKLQYANFLNQLSHLQPEDQGIATCEEALSVLAGLGALDLSDLSAASAWADIADSEAGVAMVLGRFDDAERLEKQTQTLAEGVLARCPGDLRARLDLYYTSQRLATIEANRFHHAAAFQLAARAQQAAQDYVHFNPSDQQGWLVLDRANYTQAALLFRQGRIAEGLQTARVAAAMYFDPSGTNRNLSIAAYLQSAIGRWEAQRGERAAAEQSLQDARHSLEAYASRMRIQELSRALWAEQLDDDERQVKLALGQDAAVCTMSKNALTRLERLRAGLADQRVMMRNGLTIQGLALSEAAQAALNLGRYADAEAAARAWLSLRSGDVEQEDAYLLDRPDDIGWGRVLLAQAVAGQDRRDEALKTLEPALAHYREAQTQGAAHLAFRQHFARALYVQALAEPDDSDGNTRRRDEVNQAARLLQGLPDEARQLHDSRELLAWIEAEQKKPDLNAQHP